MKTIVIKPGSNGARILEHLDNRKKELEERMRKRTEEIREIGWDAYVEKRVAEGAKIVRVNNGSVG